MSTNQEDSFRRPTLRNVRVPSSHPHEVSHSDAVTHQPTFPSASSSILLAREGSSLRFYPPTQASRPPPRGPSPSSAERSTLSPDPSTQPSSSYQNPPPLNISEVGPVGFLAWFQRISSRSAESRLATDCYVERSDSANVASSTSSISMPGHLPEAYRQTAAGEDPSTSAEQQDRGSSSFARPTRQSRGSLQTWRNDDGHVQGRSLPAVSLYPAPQGETEVRATSCPLPAAGERRCPSQELGHQERAQQDRHSRLEAQQMFAPYWRMMGSGRNPACSNDFLADANSTGVTGPDASVRQSSASLDRSRLELQEVSRVQGTQPPQENSTGEFDPLRGDTQQAAARPVDSSFDGKCAVSADSVLRKRKATVWIGDKAMRRRSEARAGGQGHSGVSGVLHPQGSQLEYLVKRPTDWKDRWIPQL